MLGGILSPAFLQAAGNGQKFTGMRLFAIAKNPTIGTVYCDGTMTVTSIVNGQKKVVTYSDLDGESLQIQADTLTTIKIEGNLTGEWEIGSSDFGKISVKNTALESLDCSSCYALQELNVSTNTALESLDCSSCSALQELNVSTNTALESLDCSYCSALQELNVSTNTALTSLSCSSCYALQELNVSTNTALESLDCSYCYALQELNVSTNTALTSLNCTNCRKVENISTIATNSTVATAIANLITANAVLAGTVYVNSDDTYYSTIETAAQGADWTIEPLSA